MAVSLAGIDDQALRSAMAELVSGLGATLAPEDDASATDLSLVLVTAAEQLIERLDAARSSAPGAALVVLVPFQQPRLTTRALALGASACHGLDQPTEHLLATLRALLEEPEEQPAPSGRA